MPEITSSLLAHRLSVGQTGRWIKLLILYVFKRRSEIRHPIVNVACKCACVCERETDDTLPQVLKPGIHRRSLILPGPSSARPLAGARWLGRKTAVRERTRVDKPFVHTLRLHPQPVQTKQLWAQRTCVRIGTPKPAEKKTERHNSLPVASKFMEGIALGEPSFTFHKGLFLGLLILSLLPGASVSSSANSLPAAEGAGSGIHGFGVNVGIGWKCRTSGHIPDPPESASAFSQNPLGFGVYVS
ncbi:uncharacterized protein LOC123385822 [Felis catus]|uniref:uncharacterized protein LOC123385822 n=1 Tax=Felis catus TaxID=9685 RepID=UPI001D19BE91|nr:uncharacterized protein LOC123385822 [Felis catus]